MSESCAHFQEQLAEAALGLLEEPERSDVLAHVGECRNCRAEFDELVHVSDRIVALAPEADPPHGFHARVLARMEAATATDTSRRRRSTWLAVAAACVALGAGLAIGLAVDDGGGGGSSALAAIGVEQVAELRTDVGVEVGRVALAGDDAPVALVQLDRSRPGVAYRCQLVLADESIVDLGEWTAEGDDGGAYSAAVPALSAPAEEVQMLRPDGTLWASGPLT